MRCSCWARPPQLAASVLTATMLTAINRVHKKNGPWASDGGFEYNLVLIALVTALAETGPGSPSVDDAIGLDARGSKWALLSLLMGALGAAGAHAVAEAAPAPAPEPATPEAQTGSQPDSAPDPAPQQA